MSYSIVVPKTPVRYFSQEVDAAFAAYDFQWNPPGKEDAAAAVEAAKSLVASGILGGPDVAVTATISGHGNEGHGLTSDGNTEHVVVSISGARP